MALSTQADLEKYLQIDVTAEPEPVITLLLGYAQAVIETYCDRSFEASAGIVEKLDGNRDRTLFLRHFPVTAVNSVTEDGSLLVEDVDFVWYPDGRLVRGSVDVDWRWTGKRKGVVVDYDAGYSTIPDDLAMVSTRIAGRIFQASSAYANAPTGANGVKSISLDGSDSIEFADAVSDVVDAVADLGKIDTALLQRYRRVVL